MSPKQEIANWLNQNPRPFNEGLMLHLAYLNDKAENTRIQRSKDNHTLYKRLRDYYYQLKEAETKSLKPTAGKGGVKAVAIAKTIIESAVGIAQSIDQKEHALPDDLKLAWHELKTEQERWHTEMSLIGEGKYELSEDERERRAKIAKLIYDREVQLQEIGTAFNFYKEHGHLPDGFSVERKAPRPRKKKLLTGAEAKLYIKVNLAPNISKLKKKIAEVEALPEADKSKKLQKLSKWREQLADLVQQKTDLEDGA
jgi:hypothetical protein